MRKPVAPLPQRQLVTFRLGGTEFGLDVGSVHEVLRHQPVTPLPGAPDFIEGVIDVRGALLPVIDLRRRFGVPNPGVDAETRVLVVDFRGERLGLVVDRVTEVLRLPEEAVTEPPGYVQGQTVECVVAIARLPERLVVLLDIERVLGSDEALAISELEELLAEMRAAEAAAEEPVPEVSDRNGDEGTATERIE